MTKAKTRSHVIWSVNLSFVTMFDRLVMLLCDKALFWCYCAAVAYHLKSHDGSLTTLLVVVREQRWRSNESARLPPMWPGFDSRTRRSKWVKYIVDSRPCSEGFSPGSPVFLPPQKSTPLNANSIWKQWMKSHFVEMPPQILIYRFTYLHFDVIAVVFLTTACEVLQFKKRSPRTLQKMVPRDNPFVLNFSLSSLSW